MFIKKNKKSKKEPYKSLDIIRKLKKQKGN